MSSQHSTPQRSLSLLTALVAAALLLFSRLPTTGYVFDEQEALLFNPYLHGQSPVSSAFRLDFWGLPADRSIGSYRPLPNLLWRTLGPPGESPFFHQLINPVLHGINAFLLAQLVRVWGGTRNMAWVAAWVFVTAGVCTEAVASVVGLSDLLVVTMSLACLLSVRLALGVREVLIACFFFLGLMGKETMWSAAVPILLASYVRGADFPRAPSNRALRALGLLASILVASFAFVAVRRVFFLGDLEPDPPKLAFEFPWLSRLLALSGQPKLPIDPQNNPLIVASPAVRIATGLRIYALSFVQMIVPYELTADYSFPRIVPAGFDGGSLAGLLLFVVPPALVGLRVFGRPSGRRQLSLGEFGLLLTPLSALPISNLLVVLPTIRAERLLYLPLLGVVLAVASLVPAVEMRQGFRRALVFLIGVSALSARAHASHYQSDVLFWRATTLGDPASAKAHLNLGVMLGARGDSAGRLRQTLRAVELAPTWGLAHVYVGDAKCRGGDPESALPHYLQGLSLAPNSKALSALALQCLYEEGQFDRAYDPLVRVAARDPDGWLAYLLSEVAEHGEEHGGLPRRYRPRGYNQAVEGARQEPAESR